MPVHSSTKLNCPVRFLNNGFNLTWAKKKRYDDTYVLHLLFFPSEKDELLDTDQAWVKHDLVFQYM